MNMFFSENQWNETWSMGNGGTDATSGKSEHAISQPITMVQRRNEQYNNVNQPQSVTSPRSGDGSALGVHMVEYVLASSPGGHDLENRMKDMKLETNLVSPFVTAREMIIRPSILGWGFLLLPCLTGRVLCNRLRLSVRVSARLSLTQVLILPIIRFSYFFAATI